jgi:hypothetical protein
MNFNITLRSNNGRAEYRDNEIFLTAEGDHEDTRFSMTVEFPEWEKDTYLFMPSCVYDGNAFEKMSCRYPPIYRESDLKTNACPIISDIPALNPDRSGKIEVTSGDLSVPCVGVFFRKSKEAFFLFTEQACKEKNVGFSAESGRITVQFPAIRSRCYRMCRTSEPSRDSGISVTKGETVSSKVLIKDFACADISEFFTLFFQNRRCLLSDAPAPYDYTRELWNLLERHMNEDNFSGEYYAEISKKWQCGWVGGGMSSLPLLKHGAALSKQRAVQTLNHMTANAAPSGFFYPMIVDGRIEDDGFGHEHMKHSALVRKLGDALAFLLKHFEIISPKESWVSAAKSCADAFVRLYKKYSDFGQFIHVETGEILYGGTTSGASAIGALVRAWRYFEDPEYLGIAKLAGEKYYTDFVARGFTYGGPGEALCAPDSESAYAMLESMILLYEADGDKKWLRYAKDSLHLLSSWVMPYSYAFPRESEFGRLGVNTVGSVFANAQNKHSAPGLCTASGDAIYKLYKYTNIKEYLQLLRDIVFFMPQCVSTEKRPVFSWDKEPRMLPPGWICERVNTSDWEGTARIGEVFYGSCWCETSLLLTFSELIWNEDIAEELCQS